MDDFESQILKGEKYISTLLSLVSCPIWHECAYAKQFHKVIWKNNVKDISSLKSIRFMWVNGRLIFKCIGREVKDNVEIRQNLNMIM